MIKKLVIVALSAVFIFAGCGDKGSGTSSSTTGKKKIVVIPKAYDVDFWKVVHGGTAKAAVENPKYEVVWQPPSVNGDSGSQKQTMESMIGSKYDAIAVCPIDESELLKTISNAKKAGSKVLVWDSGVKKEDDRAFCKTIH